jgi:hypothetical protein
MSSMALSQAREALLRFDHIQAENGLRWPVQRVQSGVSTAPTLEHFFASSRCWLLIALLTDNVDSGLCELLCKAAREYGLVCIQEIAASVLWEAGDEVLERQVVHCIAQFGRLQGRLASWQVVDDRDRSGTGVCGDEVLALSLTHEPAAAGHCDL